MPPSKEVVKMYEDKKQYYHALNIACIESLGCDIPLDIGFNILRHISKPEYTYLVRHFSKRYRVISRISEIRSKVRKIGASNRPSYLKSNSGAGYR